MSNLRILGLLIGISGLLITFFYFRGKRWHRFNFTFSILISIALISISLNPDFVNIVRSFLSLEKSEYGRLIGILVFGMIGAYGFLIYLKSKNEDFRHNFDLLIRGLAMDRAVEKGSEMKKAKPIMIIIPAFNEQENLELLLPKMPANVCGMEVGIVVVDDGSTDGTAEVAEKHGCIAARNIINRGQGGSSRVGYDILTKLGTKIGVTMDADNQHRPEDIENLVRPVIEGASDLVIGSRVLGTEEGGNVTRRTGIIVLSMLISFLTGVRLTDCSSGFKAFNMEKMKTVDLREEQFQAAELLIAASKKGLLITEAPIIIGERIKGKTKKGSNLRYGLLFIKSIAKAWWR